MSLEQFLKIPHISLEQLVFMISVERADLYNEIYKEVEENKKTKNTKNLTDLKE
ncbi:MAG: hypothetical protein WCP92_05425 [bacterium]